MKMEPRNLYASLVIAVLFSLVALHSSSAMAEESVKLLCEVPRYQQKDLYEIDYAHRTISDQLLTLGENDVSNDVSKVPSTSYHITVTDSTISWTNFSTQGKSPNDPGCNFSLGRFDGEISADCTGPNGASHWTFTGTCHKQEKQF